MPNGFLAAGVCHDPGLDRMGARAPGRTEEREEMLARRWNGARAPARGVEVAPILAGLSTGPTPRGSRAKVLAVVTVRRAM